MDGDGDDGGGDGGGGGGDEDTMLIGVVKSDCSCCGGWVGSCPPAVRGWILSPPQQETDLMFSNSRGNVINNSSSIDLNNIGTKTQVHVIK